MKLIKRFFQMIILIFLLGAAAILYAFQIEPHSLTTKDYQLSAPNGGQNTFTVVHLSDLEISKDYTEEELADIVTQVNAQNPDIIVFTGDLFSNFSQYRPVESVVTALSDLQAVYGKYAIFGNNDYGGGAVRQYANILDASGFVLLKNQGVTIQLSGGESVFIGGLDDDLLGSPDLDAVMADAPTDAHYSILLAHEPDLADAIREEPIDLVLSGHTHGGQVNVPYLRKTLGISENRYAKGFYELDTAASTQLFVSNGFGTSRLPVRFLVPPQIAVFHIAV